MSSIFIGWGGNENLANELAKKLKDYDVVRGGGTPNQMFVGDQIIKQMNSCDRAILLVEDKNGGVSTNLMYEWGYLVGYRRIKHIYTFMIDKKISELPSDLHGVWADEVTRKIVFKDGAEEGMKNDTTLADEIYSKFIAKLQEEKPDNYFEIIDQWPYISRDLENYNDYYNTTELAEHIVLGCLAAYYYNDNERFRNMLDRIKAHGRIGEIVSFAKIYVDVFLKSGDMSCALQNEAFSYANSIRYILEKRKKEMITTAEKEADVKNAIQSVLDDIIDILCYDLLGLINLLYLKNDLKNDKNAEKIIEQCFDDALVNFNKTIGKIDELEKRLGDNNRALIALLRSYIFNDLAHLYRDMGKEKEFTDYLEESVNNRHDLYENICTEFSANRELQNKIKQEYYIALSEKCLVEDFIYKEVTMRSIKDQFDTWQKELDTRQKTAYTNILLERLSKNIENFTSGK